MAKDKNIIEEQNLDDALVIEEFDPEQLEVEHKQAKESALKRWYSFNKQKIPMYFILLGTIFFTAFIDFNFQGTPLRLQSHIASIYKLSNSEANNLAAFYLFAIYLTAIVQAFNAFTFASRQSPFSTYLITGLTTLQVTLVSLYSATFFIEAASRTDSYKLGNAEFISMGVFITGAILFIIGTVFCWIYVNWKYVRIKDE